MCELYQYYLLWCFYLPFFVVRTERTFSASSELLILSLGTSILFTTIHGLLGYCCWLSNIVLRLSLVVLVIDSSSSRSFTLVSSFFKIYIHSMQGWTATMRHGITRKRITNRLKHTENLFRKNLQLKGVC